MCKSKFSLGLGKPQKEPSLFTMLHNARRNSKNQFRAFEVFIAVNSKTIHIVNAWKNCCTKCKKKYIITRPAITGFVLLLIQICYTNNTFSHFDRIRFANFLSLSLIYWRAYFMCVRYFVSWAANKLPVAAVVRICCCYYWRNLNQFWCWRCGSS